MDIGQHRQVDRRPATRPGSWFRFELLLIVTVSLLSWNAFADDAKTSEGATREPGAAVSVPSVPAAPSATAGPAAAAVGDSTSPGPTIAPAAVAPRAVSEATSTGGTLPDALSPWGMFVHADIVVKAVMVGLALASVATWTVLLVKTIQLGGQQDARRAGIWRRLSPRRRSGGARHFAKQRNAVALLIAAAEDEIDKSAGLPAEGIKERVAWQLERIEFAANQKMGRGMGVLATVGAVAPFVGLFGTVWGIMNSFIGISRAHTTNLAVVAPGIAEALLATAFGLAAAIPAVVIYNAFARSTGGYRSVLSDASVAILRLLSRDLDRNSLPMEVRRSPHAVDAPALSIVESAE